MQVQLPLVEHKRITAEVLSSCALCGYFFDCSNPLFLKAGLFIQALSRKHINTVIYMGSIKNRHVDAFCAIFKMAFLK